MLHRIDPGTNTPPHYDASVGTKLSGVWTSEVTHDGASRDTISVSLNCNMLAVILGNPAMIDAYKAGITGNGQPFPDGAKMAKIHWKAKVNNAAPGQPLMTGDLNDIDFMAKDSKRFADSNGWGYGAFEYNAASNTFRPADQNDTPPQRQRCQVRSGLSHRGQSPRLCFYTISEALGGSNKGYRVPPT
ncbi:MAG TPA: cytochrome P460 family protein [Steroidobacteraceae bacterium]